MNVFSRKSWPEETLQALFIAMECTWLAAIMVFFDIVLKSGSDISLGWAVLMYGPAYVFGRVSRARGFQRRLFWGLNGLLAAVCLFLTIKGVLLPDRPWLDLKVLSDMWGLVTSKQGPSLTVLVVGSLYIYGRGWYLSGKQTETEAFFAGFQVGFLVILLIVVLVSMAGVSLDRMQGLIALFFISGLTGLYLARLMTMGAKRKVRGINPWLVILPLVIGGMMLGGWALMVNVDRDLILNLLKPVLWLWEQLVRLLNYLATLIEPERIELPLDPMPSMLKGMPKTAEPRWDFAWVKTVGNIFFIVGTSGLILGALFRFLQDLLRWLRRSMDDPGVMVEFLETGFWGDLLSLIVLIYHRMSALLHWLGQRLKVWLRLGPTLPVSDTQMLRTTYRRMLRWGASHGLPKRHGQTPFEYLAVLESLPDDKQAAFRDATDLYVRFRYGPVPAESSHVSEMKSFWDIIRKRSRDRRNAKKNRSEHSGPVFDTGSGQEGIMP